MHALQWWRRSRRSGLGPYRNPPAQRDARLLKLSVMQQQRQLPPCRRSGRLRLPPELVRLMLGGGGGGPGVLQVREELCKGALVHTALVHTAHRTHLCSTHSQDRCDKCDSGE